MDAQHPLVVALDLVVGMLVMLAGVVLWRRRRAAGVLLSLTGLTWLAGFVWPGALFWHRGPLVQAVLAHPGWRPHTIPAAAVTGAVYVVSVLTPVVWFDDRATLALALALVLAAAWNLRGSAGVSKHHRRRALLLASVLGAAMGSAALLRETVGPSSWLAGLVIYDAAVLGVAAALVVDAAPARIGQLRDVVIDLGASPDHPAHHALARILRDPDLVVATWDDRRATYVNADGEPVQASMPGRAVTRVDRDGHPSLLIVHDDALEGDSRLREAVETVESMDAVNAQWRAEVARHAADVVASRRRLLGASDDERRRLAQELSLGVQARLADLTKSLRDLERAPGSHLERAIAHLDSTRAELAELAAGLRPRALESGLEPALRELVAHLRLTGDVAYEAGPLPTDVEVTAYYVCAESLANVAKHVPQARVTIDVNGRVDRSVVVQVADDGPGGADPTGGGLLGLRDRVESFGGRLELTSSTKGTTVRAELPLDAH